MKTATQERREISPQEIKLDGYYIIGDVLYHVNYEDDSNFYCTYYTEHGIDDHSKYGIRQVFMWKRNRVGLLTIYEASEVDWIEAKLEGRFTL